MKKTITAMVLAAATAFGNAADAQQVPDPNAPKADPCTVTGTCNTKQSGAAAPSASAQTNTNVRATGHAAAISSGWCMEGGYGYLGYAWAEAGFGMSSFSQICAGWAVRGEAVKNPGCLPAQTALIRSENAIDRLSDKSIPLITIQQASQQAITDCNAVAIVPQQGYTIMQRAPN